MRFLNFVEPFGELRIKLLKRRLNVNTYRSVFYVKPRLKA